MGVAGDSDLSLNNGLKIIAVLTNGNWSQVVAPRNHWHHHYHTTVLFNQKLGVVRACIVGSQCKVIEI